MLHLKWLNSILEETLFDGQKSTYEIKEKDIIVKRMSRGSLDEQRRRYKLLRNTIGENMPETSLVIACDENGNERNWIVQERIAYGRWLSTILHPDGEYDDEELFKKAWSQYSDIVKKCPGIEGQYQNFVWDDRRNKLLYTSH